MRVAHPSIEVVNTVKNLPLLLKHQVVNVRLTRGYDRCDTNVRVGLNTAEHQARRKLAWPAEHARPAQVLTLRFRIFGKRPWPTGRQ